MHPSTTLKAFESLEKSEKYNTKAFNFRHHGGRRRCGEGAFRSGYPSRVCQHDGFSKPLIIGRPLGGEKKSVENFYKYHRSATKNPKKNVPHRTSSYEPKMYLNMGVCLQNTEVHFSSFKKII